MSKLEELIQKLCPDGVECKKLGEIADINVGQKPNTILETRTKFEYINAGTTNSGYTNNYNCEGDTVTTPSRGQGGIGYIGYQKSNFWLGPLCYMIRSNRKYILTKYIFYYLQCNNNLILNIKNIGGIPSVNKIDLSNVLINIPPLEIQEEIVHILDSFTELINQLTNELTARRKQYEYYRDNLLTFGDEVERVRLKEVCINFIVPMRDKPKKFDGNIPWCRIEDAEGKYLNGSKSGQCVSQEIINEMNLKVFPIGTVICSCSASIGTYLINTQPLITNQTFIGIVTGEKLKNSYLRYYMETQTENLILLSNTSTIPYISRKKFEDMIIPLPPLSEQERIVSILDKFDSLCNDISEGLPAEIEARKKQYEYYRDKLLTFKNKNGT